MILGAVVALLASRQTVPDIYVPIHFSSANDIPWVEAKMSGNVFRFALDTGSPYPLLISNGTVKALGIDLGKLPAVQIAGLDARLVKTPAFDIEGVPNAAHFNSYESAWATDLSTVTLEGKPLDGIIGLPLLGQLKTEFDYVEHRVVFHINPLSPDRVAKARSLPYREKDGAIFVDVRFPGGTASMSFDTGRGVTLVAPQERSKLQERGSRWAGIDDLYDHEGSERLLTSNVSLAGYDLGEAAIQIRKRGNLLGNDILRCFRFTLDPENKRVLMERKDDSVRPTLPGDDIFGLIGSGGRYMIQMFANYPGNVGLKDGDELISIDGTDIKNLNLAQLATLVFGEAGSMARVKVERDGKPLEVAYKRPSSYGFVDDPEAAKSGIASMNFLPDGTWLVTAMKPKRPLWNAGIRPGDLIVAVNGKKLASLSHEESVALSKAVRKGGVILSVKTGNETPRKVKFAKL